MNARQAALRRARNIFDLTFVDQMLMPLPSGALHESDAHLDVIVAVYGGAHIVAFVSDCDREERAVRHWFALRRGGLSAMEIVWRMSNEDDDYMLSERHGLSEL